ncbi:MAG: hypothetical protein J6P95_01790 [Paludibacteraceae bacterium]|nr:hypothetical protein [Paludibacteraceae bacterium]
MDTDFEEFWKRCKELDEIRAAKYDALPEKEKKRREEMFKDPFFERISENPFGDDEEDDDEED